MAQNSSLVTSIDLCEAALGKARFVFSTLPSALRYIRSDLYPTIEYAHHFTRDDLPCAHHPAENGRQCPPRDVDARTEGHGQRTWHFLHEAATCDVGHGLDEACTRRREDRARVECRRR